MPPSRILFKIAAWVAFCSLTDITLRFILFWVGQGSTLIAPFSTISTMSGPLNIAASCSNLPESWICDPCYSHSQLQSEKIYPATDWCPISEVRSLSNYNLWCFYDCTNVRCQSEWPRGLRHETSSPARTLGSWVRIQLEAWMSVCVYSVFVLFGV
jgi:hypothetical protein